MSNMSPVVAPYGTWQSPVTAQLAARHKGGPDWIGCVGEEVWWTEPRPTEGGRATLVRRRPKGQARAALVAPWDVRNRVMEYGGQPWAGCVSDRWAGPHGPLVVFANYPDQRLYRFEPDAPGDAATPRPITPPPAIPAGLRWADPVVVPGRGEVWCVREEFYGTGPTDLHRSIVAVPLDGSAVSDPSLIRELTAGHRFLTGPRISPDGRRVAWIAWDHPAMPWDGTALLLADVADDGTFAETRTVAGGAAESVAQVEWYGPDTLLTATDPGGWWNLHRIDPATGESVNLCPREEELGGPLWAIGLRWFVPLVGGMVAVIHGRGTSRLGLLDLASGELTDVAGPWSEWSPVLASSGDKLYGVAASPERSHEVVAVQVATGRTEVIGAHHRDEVNTAYLPRPKARTYPGVGGRDVHAILYPPRNPGFTGPAGELPPYVVWAHGGPTSRTQAVYDLQIAYFTSRGIGVVEVNYGGSTGYGREYRNRLWHNWGVVDVEDCAAVAEALVTEGTAGPGRLAVRGGSAGGWTSAASLAFTNTYRCAVIYFPILDLLDWTTGQTHDFESRYLDSLVGELPGTEERYRERSPARHADLITAPFLLLQGLDDVICPPVQCEKFLQRVAGRKIPHAYLSFPGEAHGFRRAETTTACLEAELSLYGQVFGFTPPGVPKVELTG